MRQFEMAERMLGRVVAVAEVLRAEGKAVKSCPPTGGWSSVRKVIDSPEPTEGPALSLSKEADLSRAMSEETKTAS
jgi:hypothetical protein